MNLTDLTRSGAVTAPPPLRAAFDVPAIVTQMGSEVAGLLTAALERVNALAGTGHIDRANLRALQEEIERARRAGMVGQQLGRLASGRVAITRERLDLVRLMREALRQRSREFESRGLEVRQVFAPAEVMGDTTLLYALLQALLDWAAEHAVSLIALSIETGGWPSHARLGCRFSHRPVDEVAGVPGLLGVDHVEALDTMSWRLLVHTGEALGLLLRRRDTPADGTLSIEFPDTLAPSLPGLDVTETNDDTEAGGPNSQPFAGRHVLVVSARREVRGVVREALRPMGLLVDYVASVEAAAAFCRRTLPHAIVHEASLWGTAFEALRKDALGVVPNLAFVEIADDVQGFQTAHRAGRPCAQVGRAALLGSLPAALEHELTRLDAATLAACTRTTRAS